MKKYKIKPGLSLRNNMRRILPRMMREMMSSLKSAIAHPKRIKRLHKARIAAKPLRYSIEILENGSKTRYSKYFSEIKKMLQLMGTIHDLDIFMQSLDNISKTSGKKTLSLIQKIVSKQKQARKRIFKKMSQKAAYWEKTKFAKKFAEAL